jgi:cytochrome oxidase Cu insertion factor (SCO1/SenC/PrrC family)
MFGTRRYTRLASGGMRRQLVAGVMTLFLACCLIAPPVGAGAAQPDRPALTLEYESQDQNSAAGQGVEVDIKGVKVMIPDLVLRDQEGRKVRFYSDLIKGKVVVLSFFYTSCTYICTRQGRVFSELQSLLSERLGKSVFLIFVTTDPVTDTSEQLKAWATRYNANPGWTLVTGEEAEMNKLLIPFTGDTAGGGMHLAATFIGNDRSGFWTSAVGIFAPEDLLRAIDYVTQDDTDRSK